jgi:RNA polymerase sigma-70 factor (ECF subfamily)
MEAAASQTGDLFREHGAAVYRFALVMVRHQQDAEDVLQETFMKLLQHLRSGGNTDNLRGWLFTVAAHAARDRQRRRFRWLPWTFDTEPSVDPPPIRDEDGRYKALREAMRGLSPRDRLLLALRAQGLSYREIAVAAGIKESSVSQFLARATERWSRGTSDMRGAGGQRPRATAERKEFQGNGYESSYERANSSRR